MNLATWDPGRELRADGSHRIEQPQAGQQWRIHLAELVLWNGQWSRPGDPGAGVLSLPGELPTDTRPRSLGLVD